MPHWLLSLGSIVGLITGVYTLWERLFASRPYLSLDRAEGRRKPGNMVLKVQNRGDQTVVITGASVNPRIYTVADSWEFDRLTSAASDEAPYRLVPPRETVELPLIARAKDGKPLDAEDKTVWVRLYWRKSSSMQRPRLPLWMLVRTSDVTKMSGAEV